MAIIQNTSTPNLRIDYGTSMNYFGPEAPKKTFWQKLGTGLLKGVSVLGNIGAAVLPLALPGIGLPIGAGLYGLSRFSGDKLAQNQMKDNLEASMQPRPTQVILPGLFDSTPQSAGDKATDFIAPSMMAPQIGEVVVQRDASQMEAMSQF